MINVQAGVAAHVLDQQPEQAREALVAIKSASKEALRDLRGILGVLRSIDEREGGEHAPAPNLGQLQVLVETSGRAGLPTQLSITGEPRHLSATLELTVYRIVQEALTNALRYAGPASACVSLTFEDSIVLVEITDNGPGAPHATAGSGVGIAGMRERAAAVGGELSAGPLPERGFRVFARLPVVHESVG
jgi:signal transduction histidine kinase